MTSNSQADQPEGGGQSDRIAEAVRRHADLILRASGSSLRNYEAGRMTHRAILSAVLDCYEEAYRAGAVFAQSKFAKGDRHEG